MDQTRWDRETNSRSKHQRCLPRFLRRWPPLFLRSRTPFSRKQWLLFQNFPVQTPRFQSRQMKFSISTTLRSWVKRRKKKSTTFSWTLILRISWWRVRSASLTTLLRLFTKFVSLQFQSSVAHSATIPLLLLRHKRSAWMQTARARL